MYSDIIKSIKDERIVSDRKLNSAAGRQAQGRCQVDGLDGIVNALESGAEIIRIYFAAKPGDKPGDIQKFLDRGIPCISVTDGIMKKLTGTSYLIPIVGIAAIPQNRGTGTGDFVIVLDNVVDHGNIGTIIRSATAFGIKDIISTNSQSDFFYKKIISSSRGKAFSTRIKQFENSRQTLEFLKSNGYQIIATSPHATNIISRIKLDRKPVALVIGNESSGISGEIMKESDITIQIPMSGQMESLNVGVATGISIYELKFRMVIAMLKKLIRSNMGREINVTSKRIIRALDKPIKNVSGLQSMQVILMMILKCDEEMTMKQVSRDTGVFGEELDEFLKPLFEEDYIKRIDIDESCIVLTKAGERAISELWPVVESLENQIFEGFSEEEEARFRDFLSRIQKNCDMIEKKY